MRIKLLWIVVLIFTSLQMFAQDQTKLVIKGTIDFNKNGLEKMIKQHYSDRSITPLDIRPIFKQAELFSLHVDSNEIDEIIDLISVFPTVKWVEQDIPVYNRKTPDDDFYDNQWYLEQIQAVNSWNITQGGLTPNGDTIVIAILDDGFFAGHEDLNENIWRNRGEIPGDGIDNDLNGYTDDFLGINIKTGNDLHSVFKHGTSVAGVVGAKGNNQIGTTGVNWNVKLLLISEANSLSNVIEAYQYVLDTRKKYNDTNGGEGSYIIATNLSAGIDAVFPDDHPLFKEWCNIYDALGAEGVMNVNATTNSNTNIDVEGDMPGSCSSEFLIIVTNSDKSDNKVIDAGYGIKFVDLAAPGVDIFTTSLANEYDSFSGASSSSPQVTGALGLLYSAPCKDFSDLAKADPMAGAVQIKSMILAGVDKFASMQEIINSGGRLNIQNSMDELRDFCGGSTGTLKIISATPNPVVTGKFKVDYESENFEAHTFQIRNILGQLLYSRTVYPDYFGEKSFNVDLIAGKMPFGIYVITLRNGKNIDSIRILIK